MGDVRFDTDQQDEFVQSGARRSARADFADILIGWGVVKDRSQANYVLFGVTIVAFLIIVWLWFGTTSSPPPLPPVE